MTEAVALDGLYRVRALSAADTERRKELSDKLRLEMQAGTLTPQSINSYVGDFVQAGEKQQNFAKWVNSVMVKANNEQRQLISSTLKGPYAYKMQTIMGGKQFSRQLYPQQQTIEDTSGTDSNNTE
jgi:hypothetical protein